MGIAARGKNGRVAFVKLMQGQTNDEALSEMMEEARAHWEKALELVSSSSSSNAAAVDDALVSKYRKKLAQLGGEELDDSAVDVRESHREVLGMISWQRWVD